MSATYQPGHLPFKAVTSLPSGIYFVRWWFDGTLDRPTFRFSKDPRGAAESVTGKTNYIQHAASICPETFQGIPVSAMKFEFIKMK